MIAIDTSVWIAGLLSADVHHERTIPYIRRLRASGVRFAVPAHFPAEVVGMLSRTGQPDSFIQMAVRSISSGVRFHIYPVSREQGMLAADIARRAKVRGSDAIFLALAQELGIPLITWDRQQRERGMFFCHTMTPTEAMEMNE